MALSFSFALSSSNSVPIRVRTLFRRRVVAAAAGATVPVAAETPGPHGGEEHHVTHGQKSIGESCTARPRREKKWRDESHAGHSENRGILKKLQDLSHELFGFCAGNKLNHKKNSTAVHVFVTPPLVASSSFGFYGVLAWSS